MIGLNFSEERHQVMIVGIRSPTLNIVMRLKPTEFCT